jgi:hypothetical protein
MTEWHVTVRLESPQAPTLDVYEKLHRATSTFFYMDPLAVAGFSWQRTADTIDEALRDAAQQARDLLREAGHPHGDIIHISAVDYDRPSEVSDLCRYSDIALYAGLSRQRIAQLSKTDPKFPTPIMHLTDGTPLFAWSDAFAYGQSRANN